jgi:uncharacterized protein YdcH (DUF465 family)
MSNKFIKSLLFKSAKLSEEIAREHRRKWPDQLRLLRLKKIRLAIKDRIQRMISEAIQKNRKPAYARTRQSRNTHSNA